jgi:hypothetical protein
MAITVSLSTSAFLTELMNLSRDIVWKNQGLANQYETTDSQIDEEIFLSAKRGVLTFDTIFQLDEYTLKKMGYDDDQISAALDDKYCVDAARRTEALNIFVSHLIEYNANTGHYVNYDEPNNYYRMINGLPDINDTDYIYQTKYSDISTTTPIHLLPLVDRYRMSTDGYLDELLTANPTKKYIKYLAERQIDPFNARIAERFAILWMNSSEYQNLYNDFREQYEKSRQTVLRVYYNTAYSKNNNSYESFMAMCCDFMTVQLMFYKYLSVDITRDFYDLDSIKYIYESYNVPFYSSIPLEYHKKIVKNINRLLGYKGSTRVFFDLFNIFNYGDMDVYEYYLLRTHKFDENGMPIFSYNEDGTPNQKAMYEIKFGKVRLYDDPPMELSDSANHIAYEDMISTDPYWVSDADALNHIYDEEFNYLETKYVGIQTVFDMYKILFESCYFFKMILDNKVALATSSLYYNNIGANVNLFDLTIYLCSLISRKYGYEGNIPTDIPSVARVLGYDFTVSLNTIKEYITSNPSMKDDKTLLNIFNTMNVNSISSVNTAYASIVAIKDHIVEVLSATHDRTVWFAYYKLYVSVMTSKVLQSTYTKQDGKQATSFNDMLSDLNTGLYIRAISDDLDVDSELKSVLELYNKSFTNLSYVEYADGVDISSMIEHLFKILDFFKSAKSELTGYNIVYTISQRGINFFKMIDEIQMVTSSDTESSRLDALLDLLWKMQTTDRTVSKIKYFVDEMEESGISASVVYDYLSPIEDGLYGSILESINLAETDSDRLLIYDFIRNNLVNEKINESKPFSDSLLVNYERTVE